MYVVFLKATQIFWGTAWQRGKGWILNVWCYWIVYLSPEEQVRDGYITWKILEEIQMGWSEWAWALLPEGDSQAPCVRTCKAPLSHKQDPQLSIGHPSSAGWSSTVFLHWGVKSATLHSRVIKNVLVLIFILSLTLSPHSHSLLSLCFPYNIPTFSASMSIYGDFVTQAASGFIQSQTIHSQ